MSLDSGWAGTPGFRKRFLLLAIAACGIFLLLGLRLWYLQVINTERYLALSEKNRIRYIPIAAPRGPVYDRDGHLLVDNRASFAISVLRQEVQDRDRLLDQLSAYLGLPKEDLLKRWEGGSRQPRFRPLVLAEDVGRDALEKIQENSLNLPGVLAEVRPLRHYPDLDMASHVFGYLGEITEGELRHADPDRYRSGDFIGKSGVEKQLEEYLRGTAGERRVEVDVVGKELRLLKTFDPVPGNRVFLTIRRDLQLAAESAFGEAAGAAVAIDVRTGEVLALASRPSFHPAAFARGISGEEWISLLQDSRHPLQNKAIKGQYPPGSTFKIVTALAALKAGVSPERTVFCDGKFTLGTREYRCWKKQGHGTVDLTKAIRESCDVWFYQMGLETGIDRIAQMARNFGLGKSLGFSMEGEKGGLIPDQKWKQKRMEDRWYNGETVINAIGQGYVLATPLQLAVMTAAVANGGTVLRPQLIDRVETLDGQVLEKFKPDVLRHVDIDMNHLRTVQRGLVEVVNEPGGTGYAGKLSDSNILVAGKTGTAQVIKQKERLKKEAIVPYAFRDHALFVAYAPAHDPQIAIAVVVEHGMHGATAAAPVARAILSSYFGLTPPPAVIAIEPEATAPSEAELEEEDIVPPEAAAPAEMGD